MTAATTFPCVLSALLGAHAVADHWVQTDRQALAKGQPGWAGRVACVLHVATYTATAVVALVAVDVRLDLDLAVPWVVLGLAVSAGTHYWADRRTPLRRVAAALGKAGYWDRGGAYALDQSFHIACLFIAALVIA